jgi:hypothetical protein
LKNKEDIEYERPKMLHNFTYTYYIGVVRKTNYKGGKMNKWLGVLSYLLIGGFVLVQLPGVIYATTSSVERDTIYIWDFEPDMQGWTHTNGQPFPKGWDRQPSNIHTPPPSAGSWSLWIEPGNGPVSDTALSPKVATPLNLSWLKWGVEFKLPYSSDTLSIGLKYKTSGIWNSVKLRHYVSSFNGWDSVDVSDYYSAESVQVYAFLDDNYFVYWAGIDNIELRGYQFQHDVGVPVVTSPPGGIVKPGTYDIIGRVRNYGVNPETFNVTAIVYDTTVGWVPIFNQTLTLTNFPANNDSLVNFGQVDFAWYRVYQTVIFTQLAGDQNPSNDTAKVLSTYIWDFEDGLQGWTHTNGQPFPLGWDRRQSDIHTPPPSAGDWSLWIEVSYDTALSPIVAPLNLYFLKWAVEYTTYSSSSGFLSIGLKHKTCGIWSIAELKHYSHSNFNGWDSVDISAYCSAESVQVYAYYEMVDGGYWAGIDNIELRGYDQLPHDVGVPAVTSPPGGPIKPGNYDIIGHIRNYGVNPETFNVTAIVYDTTAGWVPIFNQTRTLTNLPALDDSLVNFGQVNFVNGQSQFYQTVIFTQLAGDQEPSNDTAEVLSRAHRTILSIAPDTIIAPPPAPGDTFTVSVMVSYVDQLTSWQFGMMFNPVLLQCLNVTVGPFLPDPYWIPPSVIDNNAGWISLCGASSMGGTASGTGTIAYIKFQVVNRDSGGISILDFEDTKLINSNHALIAFDTLNGYFLSQLPPPKDSSDFWTIKAPMPTGRSSLSAVAVNNKIYALGGNSGWIDHLVINEEYDVITDTWVTKAPMLIGRSSFGAAAVDGKVYAIGGSAYGNALSTNEEYDPDSNTWTQKTPKPTPGSCVAVTVNGKIYAISSSTTEEYNPSADTVGGTPWTPKAPMPTARSGLAVAAANDKIYAIGGTSDGATPLTTNEEYDPETNTWTTRAPMPAPRRTIVGIAANGKIYIVGYDGRTYEYNPSVDTSGGTPWVVKRNMPRPKCGYAVASVSDRLYAFGGYYSRFIQYDHNFMYLPYSQIPGIDDRNQQFVDGTVDLRVYPNPSSGKINIGYRIMDARCMQKDFSLKIYDVSGRAVRDLTNNLASCVPGLVPQGGAGKNHESSFFWFGDDDFGRKLAAGVYFVRLETESYNRVEKAILLR